jgi:hypothetical protein
MSTIMQETSAMRQGATASFEPGRPESTKPITPHTPWIAA